MSIFPEFREFVVALNVDLPTTSILGDDDYDVLFLEAFDKK